MLDGRCATLRGTSSGTLTRMRVVLAHGASGDASSMRPHVDGLRARGVDASAIDVPLRKAEKAVDAYRLATASLPEPSSQLAIGGQSYGGRVASLLVAQASDDWAGLVLFSYPLHRPGQPDWDERSRHWPSITLPVLLLLGESDPFAKIELLRRAVDERLTGGARVVTYPRQGHSLKAVLDDALDEVASFMADLRPTDAKA